MKCACDRAQHKANSYCLNYWQCLGSKYSSNAYSKPPEIATEPEMKLKSLL